MKADNSRLQANACSRRSSGRYFGQAANARLTGLEPRLLENQVSPIVLDWPPKSNFDTCESQILAARAGKIQLTALSRGQYPGATLTNDTLPGLNSIGFWDGAGPQDWGFSARRNKGFQIHFVQTGRTAFKVDQQHFELGAGDFAVTIPWQLQQLGDPNVGPGCVHWLDIDVGVKNPNDQWRWPDWVMLTSTDLAELTQRLRRNKMPVGKSTPEIARIFQQLSACITHWSNPHSVSRLMACLNQFFVSLLEIPAAEKRDERTARNSNREVVQAFLKGMQDNPANCDEINSLKQMAERCGMGITAFAKHTREFTNAGPMEFLKQCRLNHAARQLRERPGASITDICFSNGFNSSQYFATCFRKQFKMSPSEFVSRQTGL